MCCGGCGGLQGEGGGCWLRQSDQIPGNFLVQRGSLGSNIFMIDNA